VAVSIAQWNVASLIFANRLQINRSVTGARFWNAPAMVVACAWLNRQRSRQFGDGLSWNRGRLARLPNYQVHIHPSAPATSPDADLANSSQPVIRDITTLRSDDLADIRIGLRWRL